MSKNAIRHGGKFGDQGDLKTDLDTAEDFGGAAAEASFLAAVRKEREADAAAARAEVTNRLNSEFDAAQQQAFGPHLSAEATEKVDLVQQAKILDIEQEVYANPVLAETRGLTKELITAGVHVPSGSTVKESSAPVFDMAVRSTTSKRPDARDNRSDGLEAQHLATVTLNGGNYTAVKTALSEFANGNGIKKLIAEEGISSVGKKVLGLSATLNERTVATLKTLGADYAGSVETRNAAPAFGV